MILPIYQVTSPKHLRLEREGCTLLHVERDEVDLTRQDQVESWMAAQRPEVVFLAAAKVGGIHANATYPAGFLYENLMIEANVIHVASQGTVEKLLFLGSSCIYPKDCVQPMREEHLLSGTFEPTNEAYAVAKIAGVKLCEAYRREHGRDFISVLPTNLYGPNDNYHSENSHLPAALIRRFHEAKVNGVETVTIWGTGTPLREFMFVDDLADGCVFAMQTYSALEPLNIGSGQELSVMDFARMVAAVVGFEGEITVDPSRPDGVARKLMDSSRINALGWMAQTSLEDGLPLAYADYLGTN